MKLENPKILVVLPAYFAEKTLKATLDEVPSSFKADFLLVDDGSKDGTMRKARELKVRSIGHLKNMGYGANQKTCYREALKFDYDIVVMLHPDNQYDARDLPQLVEPIINGEADLVFGSRFLSGHPLRGGMPLWKWCCNRASTKWLNLVLRSDLSEFHSGYRAYRRGLLEKLRWRENSNGFLFDIQMLFQVLHCDYRVREISTATRYPKEASSIGFFASMVYGFGLFRTSLHYLLCRVRILRSEFYDLKAPEEKP